MVHRQPALAGDSRQRLPDLIAVASLEKCAAQTDRRASRSITRAVRRSAGQHDRIAKTLHKLAIVPIIGVRWTAGVPSC